MAGSPACSSQVFSSALWVGAEAGVTLKRLWNAFHQSAGGVSRWGRPKAVAAVRGLRRPSGRHWAPRIAQTAYIAS